MKQLDVYIARNVVLATLAVVMVIVGLDAIFALVDEMDELRGDYQFPQAMQYMLMRLPRRAYEYMQMACLIGCLAGLGSMAASNELTVMRAAGISVWRIMLAVFKPMALLMALSMLNAEYAVPYLERSAESMKLVAQGRSEVSYNGGKGYWHREGQQFARLGAVDPNGVLFNVNLYNFDEARELRSVQYAAKALYVDGRWQLQNVRELKISPEKTHTQNYKTLDWATELTPRSLSMVMYEPRDMSISDLYSYSAYLKKEGLNADRYLASFWAKVNQPLGTFALVLLGISFIFGPLRSVTPGFRIFSGIMVGLIYKYAEELLAPVSILLGFAPLIATLVPMFVCAVIGGLLLRRAG